METNLSDASFRAEQSWESPLSVTRFPFLLRSESFCESARRVWGLWRFLILPSRPRCPRCAGPKPVFVRGVLVSNLISIRMAAPLSPQLQLSSLKLTRSASLSTSSPLSQNALFLCFRGPYDRCSVPLHWCRCCRSPSVLPSLDLAFFDPLTRNIQPGGSSYPSLTRSSPSLPAPAVPSSPARALASPV